MYNAVDRLTKVANGTSSNSYYYDARGNTTSEVQRIDGNDYSLTYAYDKADHLTNIVYPSKNQVAYIYTNGQVSKIAYGNGLTETIAYNTDYSIKNLSLSNDLLNRDYTYYPNGQIKSISNLNNYDYDQLGSMTKADNHSYSYDQVSNRKSASEHGTSINYTIATNSNRLTSSKQGTDETKYEYDSAGNIIKVSPPKVGATNYVYDNLNRLTKVEVDGLQNGKTLASYQYNAFSQRIQKDVNGAKTIFIYNSAGQLLEEQNKQQNTIRDYVYVDGQLIAAIENGIISYITTDHLNAPQIITSQTGQTIWSAKYDPFGKATVTGNIKYNLRADGQYQDDETGLYYNWYRYYNPELGRYITSDPLGLQAGMNTYIYVNGNPINYTDPMGLATCYYKIGQASLTCLSNDQTQSISINSGEVFSGMKGLGCMNNPSPQCLRNKAYGPIVPGTYKMVHHDSPEKEQFWRLKDSDYWRCNSYLNAAADIFGQSFAGDKRCAFQLHPGSVSEGCITVDKTNQDGMSKYNILHQMLLKEQGKNIMIVSP